MVSRWATVRDVLADVAVEMHARRARTALMIAAVAMSTGTLLSAVGISTVAARQVDADMAASTLDLISVVASSGVQATADDPLFPDDASARVAAVDLVDAAGQRLDPGEVTTVTVTRAERTEPVAGVTVAGLTSGYLEAVRAPHRAAWLLDGSQPVALLGPDAAQALDVPPTLDPTGLTIRVNGEPFQVVGFLDDGGDATLTDVVALPYRHPVGIAGSDVAPANTVRRAPGAGTVVADVVRLTVRPDAPQDLASSQVVDVSALRTGVSTQLDRLAAWVGALLLALTVLLIGNAMVVSVMSRTGEIGLRRAIGASRARVAAMFWTEGALSGAVGGVTGSALAAVAVVVVAAVNGWTASVNPVSALLGPTIGLVAGVVSSLYPALRAAAVEPAQAVRAD